MKDFSAFFELTPDLVCLVSKEGMLKKINPAVCQTLRFSEDTLLSRPVLSFLHPDDKELTARSRAELLTGRPLLNFQNRYRNRKGETVWLEWTSIYQPETETVFAIAKNITERKLTELALHDNFLQLQQLTMQLKQHNDWERQQLAGRLHEDLGQVAAAIKLKMEWLSAQDHSLPPRFSHLLQQTVASTNQMVNTIRRISYALNPANVQALGLNDSLQLLCTEFAATTGIRCEYRGCFREDRLSAEVKADLYRVCQEALQLGWKQSGASLVSVCLQQTSQGLRLTANGNGTGLEQDARVHPAIGVMQARALSNNGRLIMQNSRTGTMVRLLLPACR